MATLNQTTQCFECKLYKVSTCICEGCSKEFCGEDIIKHQQMLNEQFNVISNDYDQFQHTIDEQKQHSSNQSLIEEINQWEKNSIEIIQQNAQKCRQIVIEHSKEFLDNIEKKFLVLSRLVEGIHEENEFNELHLNYLRDKLTKLTKEFNDPKKISIQKNPSSTFIDEISIVIANKFQKAKSKQDGEVFVKGQEKKTISVADQGKSRIIQRKCDGHMVYIIRSENESEDVTDQLERPTDVIVDQQNHSLIVAERGNRRIIRCFDDQKQEILIENISCRSLTMDKDGLLYVSDCEKDEVRRWKIGEKGEGTLVAGGNGKGDQLNQLNVPFHIFVDGNQSIYISDYENHRVMKWLKDASEGIVVAGGNGIGNHLNQLSHPQTLFVDSCGQIYILDFGNDRIMRWCEGSREGEVVRSGNAKRNQTNQLDCPTESSFDQDRNLHVAD